MIIFTRIFLSFCVIFFSITLNSCKEDSPSQPPASNIYNGQYGTVTGKFIAPNGDGIPGVVISIQSSYSNLTSVTSDTAGNFIHDKVPVGNAVLTGKKGNFNGTINITVVEGVITPASPTVLLPKNKMAFVEGTFDRIQDVINGMGYTVDSLGIYDLGNNSKFNYNKYSAVFLNGGLLETDSILTNLKKFVQDGGLLYASDWACYYVAELLPGIIEFDKSGDAQELTAQVIDSTLRKNLGKSEISITYDFGIWAAISAIDMTKFNEIVRGSYTVNGTLVTNKPLAVYHKEGNGIIVYTSFHNQANATTDMLKILKEFIFF